MRRQMVLLVAAVVALAILMNQGPAILSSSSASRPASNALDSSAVTDSGPDMAVELANIPPAMALVVSEYLRKTQTPPTSCQVFAAPQSSQIAPRRDQLMIMVDILVFAHQPATRKGIIRNLNMSQLQLKRYLRFLLEKGFIIEERGHARTYRVTERGSEFVRLLAG